MNASTLLSTLITLNQQKNTQDNTYGQLPNTSTTFQTNEQKQSNIAKTLCQRGQQEQPLLNQQPQEKPHDRFDFKQFMATTNPHDLNEKLKLLGNGPTAEYSAEQAPRNQVGKEVIPQPIASLQNMMQTQSNSAFRPFRQQNTEANPQLALLQQLAGLQNRSAFQSSPFDPLSSSLRHLSGFVPQDPASLLQQRLLNDPCKYLNTISTDVTGNQQEDEEEEDQAGSLGRWTIEEKQRFIDGLRYYGKDWKRVEKFIATRSGAQVRSHAQKFFINVKKNQKISIDEYIKFVRENPTKLTPQHPKFEGAKKRRRRRDAKKEFKEDDATHQSIINEDQVVEPSDTPSVQKEADSKPEDGIKSDRGRRLSTDIGEESGNDKSSVNFKEISSPLSPSSTTMRQVKIGSSLQNLLGKRPNPVPMLNMKIIKDESTDTAIKGESETSETEPPMKVQKTNPVLTYLQQKQESSLKFNQPAIPSLQSRIQELAEQTQKQENLKKLMGAIKNQILVNEINKQTQVQQFLKEISSQVGLKNGEKI